jgi:hypothetical protein
MLDQKRREERCAMAASSLPPLPEAVSMSTDPRLASTLTSTDQKLVRFAELGDVETLASSLARASAPGLEVALNAAIANRQAAVVLMLLERGALATAIGVFPSALHRPGLTYEQRLAVMEILLGHYRDLALSAASEHASSEGSLPRAGSANKGRSGPSARDVARAQQVYRHAVSKVLNAGAAQREGPLLLAALVRGGHMRTAFEEPALLDPTVIGVAHQCLSKALQLNKKAMHISWSVARQSGADAVVCDLVRVPIRRHFSGYLLAQQQLHLCSAGLSSIPWSVATAKDYPRPFRAAARSLLLCWQREPLNKLPPEIAYCVLEQLAALTYWRAPVLDLGEGEDIVPVPGQPLSKLSNYKALS